MLALCNTYTKKDEDALEVLQDGFLKIFQQIHTYDASKSSLYTWMRTVMIRTAIDFLRKNRKEPQTIEWEELHDSGIDAEAMQKMSTDEISTILMQLSETTRAVFKLFISEGYSHKEIGEFMKISEGTSRWHLSEARKYVSGHIKNKLTA
jgi:RNA polymerase sigma-70 factor (ECF subfamily)